MEVRERKITLALHGCAVVWAAGDLCLARAVSSRALTISPFQTDVREGGRLSEV